MKNINWDIIGINEMRRPSEKIIDLGSKYILYNMGIDKKYGEVGFLINRKLSGIIVVTVDL